MERITYTSNIAKKNWLKEFFDNCSMIYVEDEREAEGTTVTNLFSIYSNLVNDNEYCLYKYAGFFKKVRGQFEIIQRKIDLECKPKAIVPITIDYTKFGQAEIFALEKIIKGKVNTTYNCNYRYILTEEKYAIFLRTNYKLNTMTSVVNFISFNDIFERYRLYYQKEHNVYVKDDVCLNKYLYETLGIPCYIDKNGSFYYALLER